MLELQAGSAVNDRYRADIQLGEGGMAVVWRVRHLQLGTVHALKVLKVAHTAIRDRLLLEGRVQAALQHPNVVSVTDVIDVGGAPGLIMEYIAGPSLDRLLTDRHLTLEQADSLARGIIKGVAAAHKKGLIHRDLKPANIMLAVQDGELLAKVTDFGLAKILAGDDNTKNATRTGMAMGTPSYMSPEQINDSKSVDERGDVFALGAILYELVTGKRAFDGENMMQTFSAIMGGVYKPPRELVPDLPEALADVITAAMRPKKDERTADCATLLQGWQRATAGITRSPDGPWDTAFLAHVTSLGAGDQGSLPLSLSPSGNAVTSGTSVRATFVSDPYVATMEGMPRNNVTQMAPVAPSVIVPAPSSSWLGRLALFGGVIVLVIVVAGIAAVAAGGGVAAALMFKSPEAPVALAPPVEVTPPVTPVVTAPPPVVEVAPIVAPVPDKPPVKAAVDKPPVDKPPVDKPPVKDPPVAAAPSTGRVKLGGDASAVTLVSGGKRFPAGEVPAGTYTIEATFPDAGIVEAGRLEVTAGSTINLICRGGFYQCSPE